MDNVNLESCPGKSEASEAVRYENVFLERHEQELNVNLVIAILFSVVGVAIALGTRPELTDSQATALTISLAINHSVTPGETLVVPLDAVSHVRAPPADVANAISYFYMSSLFSLVTVILTMMAKEFLSNYHPQNEVPAIDRSESSRRKFGKAYRLACCAHAKCTRMALRIPLVCLILGFCQRLCPTHTTIVSYSSLLLIVVPGFVGFIRTAIDVVRAVW